ncbi:MAG: hypothetical protein KDA98_14640 [Acidimicrobiales bacterium]|nr:hypothetical protein [Acidimicrobiales bacterium]
MSTLLKALEEPGTLDPLGIGVIRDIYSDRFAPGTSTIQTRLRYFVFLPWIFERIERDRVSASQFARRLRRDEAQLIESLRHLGPDNGVIGYHARGQLLRMPSTAYWGGLGSWGIRRHDLSLAEYGRAVEAFWPREAERDDDGVAANRSQTMWTAMPPAPDGFPDVDLTFELTRSEAELVREHIVQRHAGSLLAAACADPAAAADTVWPWDLDQTHLAADLAAAVHHARCVSELTLGPQHLYNLLLARKAHTELGWETSALHDKVERDLAHWAELVAQRRPVLEPWVERIDDEFWPSLDEHRVKEPTRRFVSEIVRLAVEDPEHLGGSAVAQRQLELREQAIKGPRARLTNRGALEAWNQQPFGGQLIYRWHMARSYLSDLAAGLEAVD